MPELLDPSPEIIHQFKLANSYEQRTMIWNLLGVGVTTFAQYLKPSAALMGMSLVYVLHIFSSVVVLAQLNGLDKYRESIALKIISIMYFILSVYMVGRAVIGFSSGKHYTDTLIGIFWLGVSYFVMLKFSRLKRGLGHSLQNQILIHISHMNLVDSYIALGVLSCLILSTFASFYWADPAAALILVGYACEEGIAAWRAGTDRGRAAELDFASQVAAHEAAEKKRIADDSAADGDSA